MAVRTRSRDRSAPFRWPFEPDPVSLRSPFSRPCVPPSMALCPLSPGNPQFFKEVPRVDASRRPFIKTTLAGGAGISAFGFSLAPVYAQTRALKIGRTTETRSTCPYCSVSCGVIIHTLGDKAKNVTPQVVHVEGDPDHPINRGTLCPKGSSLYQDILNDRRLLKPEVRRPGSDRWEDIGWDQAIEEVARHIKKPRDDTVVTTDPPA